MSLSRRKFINSLLGIGELEGLIAILYLTLSYIKPPKLVTPKVNSVKAGLASEFSSNSYKIINA